MYMYKPVRLDSGMSAGFLSMYIANGCNWVDFGYNFPTFL